MLAAQAKDIRIKDLEAELAAMKTKLLDEGYPKDIRIKDLEAELADTKTGARLDFCKIGSVQDWLFA